jgi:purine-nucleoside phosphorylase
VPFRKIPYFPEALAPGRHGRLMFGTLGEERVVVMEGRGALCEGYFHRELAFPLRVLARMGLRKLVLAASVLTLDPERRPGDLVVVEDHIDLSGGSPLRGLEPPVEPFSLDPSKVHCAELRDLALAVAQGQGLQLRPSVAAFVSGPLGPTAAEARMLSGLGADVVSMAPAPEVMMALFLEVKTVTLGVVAGIAGGGGGEKTPSLWGGGHLGFFKELLHRM